MVTDERSWITDQLNADRNPGPTIIGQRRVQPDTAASANRLARQLGLPPVVVERNLPELQADASARRTVETVRSGSDKLQQWYRDPRNAAAASDDAQALKSISDHFRAFWSKPQPKPLTIGGAVSNIWRSITEPGFADRQMADLQRGITAGIAARAQDESRSAQTADGFFDRALALGRQGISQLEAGLFTVGGALNEWSANNPLPWTSKENIARERASAAQLRARAQLLAGTAPVRGQTTWDQVKKRPTPGNIASFGVETSIQSLPGMATAMFALPVYVTSQSGNIGQQRAENNRRADASISDVATAAPAAVASALLERLGIESIFAAPGKSVVRRIAGAAAGEAATEFAQSGVEYAGGTVGTEKGGTIAEALDQAFAGAVGGAFMGGTIRGAHEGASRVRAEVRTYAEANRARAQGVVMDSLMSDATTSKLRERDPEAFRDFVASQTENTAVENVYIPAEAIRDLMQDGYRDDPFWGDYADQIDEALALDGDVVLPTADVATRLAGTDAWAALQPEARFSPGGMSEAELRSLEATHGDYLDMIQSRIAEQVRAAAAAAEPAAQVYSQVRDALAQAGFAPDAADRYAQLWAANRETWGARLGTDALAYHEANPVAFRRILPETLSRVQAADGIDTVIAAMRRGKEPPTDRQRFGPSLLEFLASRGGIDDAGGELASMGGDRWHREGAFRRKLIRRSSADIRADSAQAGMLGGSGRTGAGLDDALQAAISAGYFPELQRATDLVNGVDPGTYADLPDTQILLDAIDAELRGSPRYSVENERDRTTTDDIRTAAGELRAMLESRGIDADKASPADIKAALELQQSEAQADEALRGLDQPGGARGRALIGDNPGAIIDLFQGSDLSTVIHETGHVWLEEFKRNAAMENAPDDVKADWDTIREWFAANGAPVGEDGFIPTEAHELWARGWERYAMEGKAPSSALRRAFDAFRGWLLTIYKHVANLRVDLTPDVRAVFDRMLATQEAIDEEASRQHVRALFTDAAQAGMTEAEFAAYQQASGDARTEAFDALLYKTMATIRRERTKAWKEEEANVRADVTAGINARPEFRALHLLRTGRWLGEPDRETMKVKLDRAALVDTYGEDALSLLPKGVPPIYGEGGTDADTIAALVGFRNGDEMVRSLMGVEQVQSEMRAQGDKRQVRQRLIDEQTAGIMTERHGDPLNDGSIEEEALAAINNDRQGEIIAAEARQLGKQRGRVPTPYQVARDWAARKIAEGRVVDVASRSAMQRYTRAAAKASRSAEAAMLAGDIDETFRQKQAQMLNHALLVEAKRAADDVDAAVDRLGKIAKRATMKSVDQEYLDRAHALLEKFDFRARSQKGIDEQESFATWAAQQQANGIDVVIPPRLEDAGVHYSRMSVEELKGLDDSVKQVIHLGRLKKKLLDAQEQREFDEVVGEALGTVEGLRQREPTNRMAPNIADKVKANIASADAALLKMETVFDWLDDGNANGTFNRVVFRRIADAQARERDMMGDYVGRIQSLLGSLPKETIRRWSEHVTVPEFVNRDTGQPFDMTRDQLIAVALNIGNEGNLDKLARGYGWSPDGIMRALNRELRPEEWSFVQSMWDTIESLWPEISGLEKRLNGVEPEKVAARAFTLEDGTPMKGGYYPVVYDTSKSLTAEQQAAAAGDALFENIYTRATTPRGFTIARTNAARPVLLSLSVINRHVAEVIHDVTHREAVIDADRFLSDRRIVKAVRDTLGPEIQRQFRPWLQHIANEWAIDRRGVEGWDKLAKTLRTHSTIVGMGYRLTTILTQLGGYANSTEQIGARWMASGFRAATGTPAKTVEAFNFVMERSAEVRHRMDTLERDINANVRDLQGRRGVLANVRRFAFHGIGYMDRVVVIPTWLGAYNKALSEGMTEADAGYYADKVVRNSQGAGAAKDLAAIQRGGEFMRLATMFYSYANTFYNRQRSIARDTGEAIASRRTSDFPALLARSWWLFAVSPMWPLLVGATLGGGGPKEDEDWGLWALTNMFAGMFLGIPIVRDIAGSAASGFDYSFTPASRAIETAIKSGKDMKRLIDMDEDTEPSKRAVKNAVETTGYVTRLPVGQVSNAAQFITDWANGDVDPQTVGDWLKGLQTGKLEDERDRR